MNEDHIVNMDIITQEEINYIKEVNLKLTVY